MDVLKHLCRRAAPLFCCALLAGAAAAQNAVTIEPPKGSLGWLLNPYRARYVPPVNLSNSPRLESLVRAGNLYLSSQDVIALAIENNIDVEVQRYGPLLAREVLRRAKAGGLLRNVGEGVAAGPQSVSLQGVSLNGNGGVGVGTAGAGVSAGGGVLTQLGPSIPSLDPSFSYFAQWQHATIPQSNTVLTGTTALVQSSRTYQAQYSQNWVFGLNAQVTYASQYTSVNSRLFSLNPYTTGDIDLQLTQNLLQGFGSAVNGRNILVQKNNLKATDLQFKQQLITTVSSVLNLYWDLISFHEDVISRQREVETAQRLYEDNKKQVDLGSLAEIEITRAEAQLYAGKQDLIIAQTNLLQQEIVLKNALSRNGVTSPTLANVHVVPLDKMAVPARTELKPIDDLVSEAVSNRVEIQQGKINLESNKINLAGIKNGLKPTLQAFAELTNNGLSGSLTAIGAQQLGVSYLAGGYGNLLGEIARRNYPNYSAGLSLNIPLRNRAAQSDYVTSLIEIRQNELSLQKSMNQVRVDVNNAVIGLEQARARYDSAVKSRILQERVLDADQRKYTLGATTAYQVVQDQRDLANAQSAEVQAMANYSHAKISFDQAMGSTLESNNVSVAEAISGHVSIRPSTLPEGK